MMQRKKILYVITKSNFGGAQKYVYELATSLPQDQFAVVVALGGDGVLRDKLEQSGITTVSIPHLQRNISLLKEWRVFFFLLHLFRHERPDVVHLNSSKIGGIGSLAGRIARVEHIIFTAHGWAFNEDRSWMSKLFISISYWFTMLFTHTTIAVSDAIKNQVRHWPLVGKKLTVIKNGVRTIDFIDKNTARKILNQQFPSLDKEATWVGTLAELHPIKGLDVLIDAMPAVMSRHPHTQLLLFGEGEERNKLEKKIRAAGLESTIILLGYVDNASQYLAALDVFTLPSRSEALALVLLEAGLARLPVIAANVGGIPEVIKDTETGLLCERQNSDDLSRQLIYMLDHPNEAHELGANLHNLVTNEFDYKKMLEKTMRLY